MTLTSWCGAARDQVPYAVSQRPRTPWVYQLGPEGGAVAEGR